MTAATIGTAGDYASLALAEASIPNSSADDFEFTYIEALSDTTPVNFSISSFTGSCVVDVQEAYRCKGAVSGTHAELAYAVDAATDTLLVTSPGLTVRNLRIKRGGTANAAAYACQILVGATGTVIDRCTLIGDGIAGAVIRVESAGSTVMNNFIIDRDRTSDATAIIVWFLNYTGTSKLYRNCIFQANDTSPGIIRVQGASAVLDARQNIAIKAAGATATGGVWGTSTGTYAAECDANASSGADTPEGTTANESLDPADVFATLTVDSEDLHYPSRAAMLALEFGADISATTGDTDLDGDVNPSRTDYYPGADYVPVAVVASSGRRKFSQWLLGFWPFLPPDTKIR